MKMRKLMVLAVVAAALTTAACNTVAGVGRDAQAAGSAVLKSGFFPPEKAPFCCAKDTVAALACL